LELLAVFSGNVVDSFAMLGQILVQEHHSPTALKDCMLLLVSIDPG
jgi:hypothetical protein